MSNPHVDRTAVKWWHTCCRCYQQWGTIRSSPPAPHPYRHPYDAQNPQDNRCLTCGRRPQDHVERRG